MLNYVVALVLEYLIFDSHSYLRDTSGFEASVFPQGKTLPDEATWSSWMIHGLSCRSGFLLAIAVAVLVWVLYSRTRFGFEVQVIGDSPRAGRYAGMRTRRKIVAVMCLSGAIAGIGGASQTATSATSSIRVASAQASYGYTGIVVAALARYNPFAVVLVALLLGGLQNAGFTLQGADFPAGLVGVMQGLILFCALGGELFVRYRVRIRSGEQQPRRRRDRLGCPVRDAAALRRARRAAGGALRRPQPRRRGDDADGRRDGLLGGRAHARRDGRSCSRPRSVWRRWPALRWPLIHAFLVDHAAREPDRLRPRADDLRRCGRAFVVPRQRPASSSGKPAKHQFQEVFPKSLQDLPVIGPIVFGQSILVYASWVMRRPRRALLDADATGLNLRAVGESPAAADAMGVNVAALSLRAHAGRRRVRRGRRRRRSASRSRPSGSTASPQGAGWIAIALVIFAFWRPTLCLVGAYFFGAFTALPFALQGHGVTVAPELFQTLPYVATIVALVLVSSRAARLRFGAPAALGLPYVREER